MIPFWQKYYSIFHFVIVLFLYSGSIANQTKLTQITITFLIALILLSNTSIGLLLENRRIGFLVELLRCILLLLLNHRIWFVIRLMVENELTVRIIYQFIQFFFIISSVICILIIINDLCLKFK